MKARTTAKQAAIPAVLLLFAALTAHAHPGPLDENGGHTCNSDCEKWELEEGGYHVHPVAASAPLPRTPIRAYVEKVVDGDTLTVRLIDQKGAPRKKVRLLGLDCPESHDNNKCAAEGRNGLMKCREQVPLGRAAGKAAAALVKQQEVSLHPDGPDREDRYGRLLAYVETKSGEDLGLELLRGGHCQDFGWKYPHPRRAMYEAAEKKSGSAFAKSKPPGSLSKRELLAPLIASDMLFKACRPKREASLTRLPIQLDVRPDGTVEDVTVSADLETTTTAKCVTALARKLRYPRTRQKGNVSIAFAVRWP